MICYKANRDGTEVISEFIPRKGDYGYREDIVTDAIQYLQSIKDGYKQPASLAEIMVAYWNQYRGEI